ncbi:hypothetical protein [Nonomuraea sp. NPDC052265]|uniref:hypothetical protein n=1 Tax=Nonomuraea sp. NPDC052265 TaxID=3364374 RepID=UPI0037CB6FF3
MKFPYRLRTMCYIEVSNAGEVTHGTDGGTYQRVHSGESRLFAVWPGEWSSHLFAIDDLDQYARALGLVHDEKRTGLADHEHQVRWATSQFENKPQGAYINIDLWLDCGCNIRDLAVFAKQMREQKGWEIATSRGWGSSGTDDKGYTYSIRARRTSLTQ